MTTATASTSTAVTSALRHRLNELLTGPCPSCAARPHAVAGPGVATIHHPSCDRLATLPADVRTGQVERHQVETTLDEEATAPAPRAWMLTPDRRERPFRVVVVDDHDGRTTVFWHLNRASVWRCGIHGYTATPACRHTRAAVTALEAALFGVPRTSEETQVPR